MTTERSDNLYFKWKESTEKFDYFMLAVLGALCAYLAQGYKPTQIGCNPGTLELLSLLTLVLGAVIGFLRIEATILVALLNHQSLHANERRGVMATVIQNGPHFNAQTGQTYTTDFAQRESVRLTQKLEAIEPKFQAAKAKALRWYRLRNLLTLTGFLMLLAAKLASAYV